MSDRLFELAEMACVEVEYEAEAAGLEASAG